MKNLVFFLAVAIVSTTIEAQKIYSTKSGKISFESKATLEDIEAKNSEVESKLLASNGQIVFNLLIKGFQFPNQTMEDHFNENYLESSKYPKADFKGFVSNINEIDFTKNGNYPATANGKLTIHGVTKDISATGTIVVKNRTVRVLSNFSLKLKDYKIGGALIGKKIAETITIKVDCLYE